jgi:general secretion pathway protein E
VEDALLDRGLISQADLNRITEIKQQSGLGTARIVYSLGLVAERDMARIVAETHGLPLVHDDEFVGYFVGAEQLTSRFLKQSSACPVGETDNELRLAMADPGDDYTIKAVAMACGKRIAPCVATPSQIERALERLFDNTETSLSAIVEAIDEETDIGGEVTVERLIDLASETPVVRLVNIIISRAVEMHASDIHIEPFDQTLKVRYRIDGVLTNVDAPPARSAAAVISRLKIMAKLNIAERRLPQDGRIQIRAQGKTIDLRVSTVPTLHGESVVLRILDKEELPLDFAQLGFQGPTAQAFIRLLDQPHGIVLVTGPTGSGKTTTQYAALHRLNRPERKILTVEDPVEYQLEGINQIQVKPSIDLTFANALRSIVRQDPDIIMIGEMRDLETASIAVQSALTGHLVLSTLHTNDAGSSITRLLDMGVKDYLLTSTVNGVSPAPRAHVV